LTFRLGAEYANTFDGLERIGGNLLLQTASRLGLDAQGHYLEETLANGRRDHLDWGDCNVVFRFAQSSWAEFRSGLGLNWLGDATRTDVGFNFHYAADFYVRKPWVVSAALNGGWLGQTHLLHVRTTAGVLLGRTETYTGYDYLDVGRAHAHSFVAGLRLWY
jgi:hypothetical protein